MNLRTLERVVQAEREALRQTRLATVFYEIPPGKQVQADFGELWMPIGEVRTKVHIYMLAPGYSRRQLIRMLRHHKQRQSLPGLAANRGNHSAELRVLQTKL